MALDAAMGAFTTGTGTTAVEVGLSFAPKLVILGMTAATAADTTTTPLKGSIGAFTGTGNRLCLTWQSTNSSGTSDADTELRTDACLSAITTASLRDGLLDVSAMTGPGGGNGFTVVPDDAFAADYRVAYLALGGADLTNMVTGTFTSSATGSQAVTGLGFQPDGLILLAGRVTTTNAIEASVRVSMGWGKTSSSRGVVGFADRSGVTTTVASGITMTNRIAALRNPGADTLDSEWDLTSLDADGFTVNRTGSATSYPVGYIAWKGPQVAIGTTTSRTDTNTQAVTGCGFPPRAIMVMSSGNPTATETAYSPEGRFSLGWGTGADGMGIVSFAQDNVTSTQTMSRLMNTSIVGKYDRTGVNTWTDVGNMDLDSLDGDGFTLDQVTADSQNTLLLYMALGDAASAGGTQHKFAGKFGGKFTGKV